jgi:hypothetical protein
METIFDISNINGISSSINNVITIITGGGIVSLLGLLFDNLTKKRAEYTDLTNKRIERFSNAQPLYMRIAGNYLRLVKIIKTLESKPDKEMPDKGMNYVLTIFHIYNIVNLLEKFRREFGGLIQLDNLDAEYLIHDLMWHIQNKLTDGKSGKFISTQSLHKLQTLSENELTFDFFLNTILQNPELFNEILEWLKKLDDTELKGIRQKSYWYALLIHMEMIIMYRVYYGEKNLRHFYNNLKDLKEDSDLIYYLQNKYPAYYKRLHKIGFAKFGISS